MRFIKLGIISIVLLVIVVMAISFLLPSRVVVQRTLQINAPKDSVYKKVADFNAWKDWLLNRDTLPVVISLENGKQVLTMGNTKVYEVSKDTNLIVTNWQVNNGKLTSASFTINATNDYGTTVQWYFDQQFKWYPWEKFSATVSDKVLSPFMERSLENLKNVTEQTR